MDDPRWWTFERTDDERPAPCAACGDHVGPLGMELCSEVAFCEECAVRSRLLPEEDEAELGGSG